jgi:penicillin-binding protein 2
LGLNEGVVTPEYLIEDPGRITTIQRFYENDPGTPRDYVCWNRSGHGMVDFLRGVANSCNVYFYKITGGYQDEVPGGGLGIWRLGEYARALGYARRTGIELPGEAAGLMPDPNWKRRNLGKTGLLATPTLPRWARDLSCPPCCRCWSHSPRWRMTG